MYPGTSRTLVFLRRFVSSGPVAFSIPPQPGQGKIQVLGRLGAQHRVTKLLQIYQNSLPSRNQARQAGLLLSIEHQSRKLTQSSCSYFFLSAGSLYRRGVLDVRHLYSVVVLAEELNFTRAAHRLRITQCALSWQI